MGDTPERRLDLPKIAWHGDTMDWCHLCGVRSKRTADVWYPRNAEHVLHGDASKEAMAGQYIRICSVCALAVHIATCVLQLDDTDEQG